MDDDTCIMQLMVHMTPSLMVRELQLPNPIITDFIDLINSFWDYQTTRCIQMTNAPTQIALQTEGRLYHLYLPSEKYPMQDETTSDGAYQAQPPPYGAQNVRYMLCNFV